MRDLLKNAAYLGLGTIVTIGKQAEETFETIAAQAAKMTKEGEQVIEDFSKFEDFSLPRNFALSAKDIIAEIQY